MRNLMRRVVLSLVKSTGLVLTDPRLAHWFSGGPSYSGETVTVGTALQLDTVWSCVGLVSDTIATLPLFVYKRDSAGRGTIDSTHPLYSLLHDQPNGEMTATEYWQAQVASLLCWGNSFSRIEWSGKRSRHVVALTPWRPDYVTVRRETNGRFRYRYAYSGRSEEVGEEDMFHVKGFSLDGLVGMSPITMARHNLGSAIAAEKVAGSFFGNGMRPSAVIESPTFLSAIQREQMDEKIAAWTGALNAGKVPVIEGGFTMKAFSLPPEDAQLLATRSFQVEQICRWFRVPPIMVGHMEKSTAWGTGIEQMMIAFVIFCLRPHLRRIEHAIRMRLLLPEERPGFYAEFNVEGLLRGDSKARSELYASLADHGLRTRNELRALDNEPPIAGGDELTVNSAMLPIQFLGQVAKLAAESPVPGSTPAIAGKSSDEPPALPAWLLAAISYFMRSRN